MTNQHQIPLIHQPIVPVKKKVFTKSPELGKLKAQIKKNKKSLTEAKIEKLSLKIYKISKKYKIPSNIFAAILMQESGYSLDAMNCKKGIIVHPSKKKYKRFKQGKVCTDFGISQIYYKSVIRYQFDINKLLTDLEYSIEAGAKVLDWFHKTYGKKDPLWYTRYNCGTAGTTKRESCQKYKKLIKRYL